MTNEEIFAKMEEMEARMNSQREEIEGLKRGGASGIIHTPDTAMGSRMHGLVAARRVTIATRPVLDSPESYEHVIGAIARPTDG